MWKINSRTHNVLINKINRCAPIDVILEKRTSVTELSKVQAKLLKSAFGLPKFCYNTPLLQAMKVKKTLQVQQLSLLRNAPLNKSEARTFYLHKFKYGTLHKDKKLLLRCLEICKAHRVSLTRYVFDENYATKCKRQIYVPRDGFVDSIRSLLM